MKQPADMAVFIITALKYGRFNFTFQNNSKLGFPVSNSTNSGVPLTREELKARFNQLIDECMPEET